MHRGLILKNGLWFSISLSLKLCLCIICVNDSLETKIGHNSHWPVRPWEQHYCNTVLLRYRSWCKIHLFTAEIPQKVTQFWYALHTLLPPACNTSALQLGESCMPNLLPGMELGTSLSGSMFIHHCLMVSWCISTLQWLEFDFRAFSQWGPTSVKSETVGVVGCDATTSVELWLRFLPPKQSSSSELFSWWMYALYGYVQIHVCMSCNVCMCTLYMWISV